MKPENIEDIYTLSPTQQGMLFHILADPNLGMYLEQTSCTLHGNLNISFFERAWQQIVERHPSLRTAFIYKNLDKPLQVVYRQVKLAVEQYDWRELSSSEEDKQLNAFLQDDRKRGFQLSEPPLMRLTLIRIGKDTYQLIWSVYHLILDGWCINILLKEFFAFYEALSQGQSLHLQPSRPYRDYITWLKHQDLSEAEAFWQQTLQGFKTATLMGIYRSDTSLLKQNALSDRLFGEEGYGQQQIQLSGATTAALKSLAKHHHLTLNTLMMGGWALLLSHYSNEKNVLFGTVVSGRPVTLTGVESMVGLFVNTLPTRVQVTPQDLLLPWLKALQSWYNQLRQYEYSPLVNIQRWSDVPGVLPLFESLLACQNSLIDISRLQTGNLKVNNLCFFSRSNYPLTLVPLLGSTLGLVAHYDLNRFKTMNITRILNHFQTLLNSMAIYSTAQLGELINLIKEIERKEKSVDLEVLRNLNASKLKSVIPKTINISYE